MIVVTGATGQLGSKVIDHLLLRGVPASEIVAVDLESPRTAALTERGVEVRHGDYNDRDSLDSAFAGAEKIYFISAPTGPDEVRIRQHQNVIDAAVQAGVSLLAYTSVTHAPTNTMALAEVHRVTEAAITAAGLPAVILRNGWYTENHTVTVKQAVGFGTVVGSAGEGRMASASRADLAEAAAVVMTSQDQAGKVYDLTGDTVWTLSDLAAEIARQTGQEISYTDLPAEQYRAILQEAGLPGEVVELIVDSDVAIAGGTLDHVTTDLPTLLGRATTPLSVCVGEALATA